MLEVKKARLEKLLMQEIAELVLRALQDPRLEGVVITHVELSPDLWNAKVYFTTLTEGREQEAGKALEQAKPQIRSLLSRSLRTKRLPELHFVFDRELKRMERIWERL